MSKNSLNNNLQCWIWSLFRNVSIKQIKLSGGDVLFHILTIINIYCYNTPLDLAVFVFLAIKIKQTW